MGVVVMSTVYTAEMAHAAAERGAAWLDRRCPDWINEINLDRLDLGSRTFCMLGQTARCLLGKKPTGRAMRNGFDAVLTASSDFDQVTPAYYGFNIGTDVDFSTSSELDTCFEMLTIAWRELIRTRLEAVR